MARYCKECGHHVEFHHGEKTAYCPMCDKELTLKESIADYTLDARMTQLEAMHTLLCEANDENLYMAWIEIMPDGAGIEDFRWLALNDEMYNECWDVFVKLVTKNGMRW